MITSAWSAPDRILQSPAQSRRTADTAKHQCAHQTSVRLSSHFLIYHLRLTHDYIAAVKRLNEALPSPGCRHQDILSEYHRADNIINIWLHAASASRIAQEIDQIVIIWLFSSPMTTSRFQTAPVSMRTTCLQAWRFPVPMFGGCRLLTPPSIRR